MSRKKAAAEPSPAAIDLAALLALAGPVYWQRGEAYFRDRRVDLRSFDDSRASAVVRGSDRYRVELSVDRVEAGADAWRCACECPLGEDDEVCKHIVATALSWQAALAGAGDGPPEPSTRPASPPSSLAAFLGEQSVEVLAGRLLTLADQHAEVHRELKFWMQTARADSPQALRKALSALIGSPGFLDWRGSTAFARRLGPVFTLLDDCLTRDPGQAVPACEYALARLLKLYARSDDSGGAIGERVAELAAFHARACTVAALDGVALATTLLKLQDSDDWGLFPLARYAEALGAAGLDAYGARLLKRWQALPPMPEGSDFPDHGERGALRRRMVQWFEQQGDVDGLLAFKATDLHSAYRYFDLAETCVRHRRDKAAIDWAERGLKAFPDDHRLMELLADLLHRDGLDDEALALRWKLFVAYPGPDPFLALKACARGGWPAWRERALAQIGALETKAASRQPRMLLRGEPLAGRRPVGLRVQLHLAEAEIADALAAADQGFCEPQILERLALAAEVRLPAAAAALYARLIPALLNQSSGRYDNVVALIRRRARLVAADDARAFEAGLRSQHKAKRNFIKSLDTIPTRR